MVVTLKFLTNKNKQLHICFSESTLEESLNVESIEVEVTYELVVATASVLLFATDEIKYVLKDLSMVVGWVVGLVVCGLVASGSIVCGLPHVTLILPLGSFFSPKIFCITHL